MNPSDIARQLGQRGGLATKAKGTDYTAIGRKGAATRWHETVGSLIYFKSPLYDKVEQGAKTTTLRKRTYVRPGQPVTLVCGRRHCDAIVDDVQVVSMDSFDEQLVKSEGFATKDELVKTLQSFYPGETRFFLIRFHTL